VKAKIILGIFFLAGSLFSTAQHFSTEDFSLLLEFKKKFEENHIDYQQLSPLVSDRFPNEFIKLIDGESTLFIQEDVEKIGTLCPDFEKLSKDKTDLFFEKLYELLELNLTRKLSFLNELPNQDFFEQDSILIILRDTIPIIQTALDQEKQWTRELKNEIVIRFHDDSILTNLTPSIINEKLNAELDQLIETEKCYLETLLTEGQLKATVIESVLRAYAYSFDPHSDYLSPKEEQFFLASLSSEAYSSGLLFSQSVNAYIVTGKSPFSSASEEEEISIGDEIVSVKIDNSFNSILCLSVDQLLEVFYGDTNDKIVLQIKSSKDGKLRVFSLLKTYNRNEANHTFSYLFQNDSVKLGFIDFPGFYSNFDGYSRSSSEDMALILLNMKKLNLDGLIIDLRMNGGGSVQEAEDLLGYFIDYGPLHTITSRDRPEGVLFKDGKRGKLTNAKVLFLVDATSASASELLVSSLKTYPEILLVGSATYGKATGQRSFEMQIPYSKKSQGAALVTFMKIYDQNGISYQHSGLEPDISIPTFFSKNLYGETKLRYTLKNTPIAKNFKPILKRDEPIDELRSLSSQRVAASKELQEVVELETSLSKYLSSPHFESLHFTEYERAFQIYNESAFKTDSTIFEVVSLEEDEAFLKKSEKFTKNASKDATLQEVFKIFLDWISLKE
jgi:carboxyl-terminal processing protease